jgi:hypothetical protein
MADKLVRHATIAGDGGVSLRKIADELNTRGIKTARGGMWYAATVRNIMARDNEIEAQAA